MINANDISYSYNTKGYMFYYKGKPIGGAGMGKISLKRIFCQIVNTAWNNMDINERALFLLDVDERNTAKQ